MAICKFGCTSPTKCRGNCQPGPLPRANPAKCKWCAMGYSLHNDGSHWIVKSIVPAVVEERRCQAIPKVPSAPSDGASSASNAGNSGMNQ